MAAACPVLQTASAAQSQADAIHERLFCHRPAYFLESTFNNRGWERSMQTSPATLWRAIIPLTP